MIKHHKIFADYEKFEKEKDKLLKAYRRSIPLVKNLMAKEIRKKDFLKTALNESNYKLISIILEIDKSAFSADYFKDTKFLLEIIHSNIDTFKFMLANGLDVNWSNNTGLKLSRMVDVKTACKVWPLLISYSLNKSLLRNIIYTKEQLILITLLSYQVVPIISSGLIFGCSAAKNGFIDSFVSSTVGGFSLGLSFTKASLGKKKIPFKVYTNIFRSSFICCLIAAGLFYLSELINSSFCKYTQFDSQNIFNKHENNLTNLIVGAYLGISAGLVLIFQKNKTTALPEVIINYINIIAAGNDLESRDLYCNAAQDNIGNQLVINTYKRLRAQDQATAIAL